MTPITSQALTADAPSVLAAPRRTGFLPKAPGPSLILFALIIGLAPSLFATLYILRIGIDGGFYMPPDFLGAQRQTLLFIGLICGLAAAVASGFVLRSLRLFPEGKGPRVSILIVLLCALGWDAYFFSWMRSLVTDPMTYFEVQDIADGTVANGRGFRGLTYDGTAVHMIMDVPLLPTEEDIPMSRLGPRLCQDMGSLFAGPVETVGMRFVAGPGERFDVDIPRVNCRNWYLQNGRRFEHRPRPYQYIGTPLTSGRGSGT